MRTSVGEQKNLDITMMEILKYQEESYEMSRGKWLNRQIEKRIGDNQPVGKL
jgi:hypothetical protein